MIDDQNPDEQTNTSSGEQQANDGQSEGKQPIIKLDPANVPPELHPLIPYAEKWGISDRELQRELLRKAPLAEIEELYAILYPIWESTWRFATSEKSPDILGNYEVGIFDAFLSVFSEASSILNEEMPERWLEIVGGPGKYPVFPFDPAKFPPELQPLIPHIKKWAKEDDGIRDTVIRVAPDVELEELVTIVNQIDEELIRDLAFKMLEDKTQEDEGYALLILMELVDKIKIRKQWPSSTFHNDEGESG